MKKLLLVSILLGSVILAGCGQQQWASQDVSFDMKIKCANMKNEIQSEQIDWLLVDEVFYSKKYNTCLYVLRWNSRKFIIDRLNEKDALYQTNDDRWCEILYPTDQSDKQKCLDAGKKFEEKLKELKWE